MRPIFTIPDPELVLETSFDPMGIMPIWMHFGQRIFGDKLTTIANDIRIFNFNLFHHHVLYTLFRDFPEEVQEARLNYKDWQTETDIKTGLLIFMEELASHIFYLEGEKRKEIETTGILGLNKARLANNTKSPDAIFLVAHKKAGLLKNQLNLGMTGRYKGPMMNMRYFDRSFTYIPGTWEYLSKFMTKWSDAIALQNGLIKLITDNLFRASGKDAPKLSLQEIKASRL